MRYWKKAWRYFVNRLPNGSKSHLIHQLVEKDESAYNGWRIWGEHSLTFQKVIVSSRLSQRWDYLALRARLALSLLTKACPVLASLAWGFLDAEGVVLKPSPDFKFLWRVFRWKLMG